MKNLIKLIQENKKFTQNLCENGDKFIQFLNDVCYSNEETYMIIKNNFEIITILIAVNAVKEIEEINNDCIIVNDFYYHDFNDIMIKYFCNNIIDFNLFEKDYVKTFATNLGNTKLLEFIGYTPEYPIKYDFETILLKKNDKYCHFINDDNLNEEIEIYRNNFYCKNKKKALDVLSEFFGIDRAEINNYVNFKEDE